MRRHHISFIAIICSAVIFLSACNKLPQNARYIPKNAVVVFGVNTNQISQKVAWNMITGSKLFKDMKQQMPDTNAANLDQAGIDIGSTMYMYLKQGSEGDNSGQATALVPLDDAGKWEAYVKKSFPQATIQTQKDIKSVILSDGLCAGWNNKLLIVIKDWANYEQYYTPGDTTNLQHTTAVDNATLTAALNEAFNTPNDNRLVDNKHFKELQKDNHDVTMWLNYDLLMNQYMHKGMTGGMGLALTNNVLKDAAVAGSLDFEKGRIVGDTKYYVSDEMASIYKEIADKDADKDMVKRLPDQNLDLLAAWHVAPQGVKKMLEKLGVLGFANLALSKQGMNADYILDAFTGDMAVALNNFSLTKKTEMMTMGDTTTSYDPNMDALFVLKINKKENFRKILGMISQNGGMIALDNNTYAIPKSVNDSLFIMTDDTYAVITNKSASGHAYLNGAYKDQKLPSAASDVYGHPSALYVDVKQFTQSLDPATMAHTAHNAAIMTDAKNLIDNIMADGGTFKNGAFTHHISINFINKDENSLMELMDFAMKMHQDQADTVIANK